MKQKKNLWTKKKSGKKASELFVRFDYNLRCNIIKLIIYSLSLFLSSYLFVPLKLLGSLTKRFFEVFFIVCYFLASLEGFVPSLCVHESCSRGWKEKIVTLWYFPSAFINYYHNFKIPIFHLDHNLSLFLYFCFFYFYR